MVKTRIIRDDFQVFLRHAVNNTFLLRKQLAKKKKIHFGSGSDIKDGFINVDFNSRADIFLDVRNKLNIPDNTIEYIYSSHFIEHLEHDDLIAHLCECHRILKPRGVVRLGVPDFPNVFRKYCAQDKEFFEKHRNTLSEKFELPANMICAMDLVNRAVYEFGQHKICLDMEKISNLLIISGFSPSAISSKEFDPQIDVSSRREFTFFVEATK